MNIVNCAMLSSFLLSLPERPTAEKTTEYEDVRLIDTADGTFMGKREASWLGLAGSTLLIGKKQKTKTLSRTVLWESFFYRLAVSGD